MFGLKFPEPPNINFLDSIETIAQHHPPAASRSLSLSSSSQLSERSVAFPTALRCCVVAHPALESPEQWVPFGLLCHLKKGKKSTPRASTTSYRGSSGSRKWDTQKKTWFTALKASCSSYLRGNPFGQTNVHHLLAKSPL